MYRVWEGWGGLGRAGEAPGRCFDVRLRIYGFTDLTPSLPLPDLFIHAKLRIKLLLAQLVPTHADHIPVGHLPPTPMLPTRTLSVTPRPARARPSRRRHRGRRPTRVS